MYKNKIDHDAYDEIMEKLYEEAKPGMNYSEAEKREGTPHYRLHYLDQDRQMEIVDEVCEKHEVTGREKKQLRKAINLGPSPSTAEHVVDETRRQEGLEGIIEDES